MTTQQQLMVALQRAQEAGDGEAVADLQARLNGLGVGQGAAPAQQSAPGPSQPFRRATENALPLLGGGAFQAGVGDSAIKAALGVKQFFGGLSADQKAVLKQMQAEGDEDPDKWTRMGGEIAGNVAMTAVPGRALAKTMSAARPALAAAGVGGAETLAMTPGEGDSYGDQMLGKAKEALKSAAIGGALRKTIGAIASPVTGLFKATPEAERLFAQGVNPTLQQGADSWAGRFIGGLTSGATDVKSRLKDEAGNAVLGRITQGKVSLPGGTGQEFLDAAEGHMGDAYGQLWRGKTVNLSPSARSAIMGRVSQIPKDGSGHLEASEAAKLMANRLGDSASNQRMSYENFANNYRNKITRDAFENASGDTQSRMLDGRELLDKLVSHRGLSKSDMAELGDLNLRNFDLKRLEEAVRGASAGKEGVDISRLAAAYSRMVKQGRAMGNTTYADLVDPAARVISNTPTQNMSRAGWVAAKKMGLPVVASGVLAGAGPAAAVGAIPVGLSLLGQTAKGSKALLGQYETQKKLAQLLRTPEMTWLTGTVGNGMRPEEDQNAP